MKIAITGGSGLVGSYLIPKLIDKHEVSIISRSGKIINKVNTIIGDPSQTGEWMLKLSDVDIIINLAGENIFAKRWTKNQKSRLIDSRVETTKNVVEVLNKSTCDNPLLISISGADYYPQSEDRVFDELDEVGDTFLAKLCEQWEKPVLNLDERVRKVVFRMGVIFSHENKTAEKMFLTHKFFIGGWVGSGRQIYSWIHIDDVVNAIIHVINRDIDGTYNLSAPDSMAMREIAKIGGKLLHRWTWTFVPSFVLKIVLGERADMLLKGRAISPQKLIDTGFDFKFDTVAKALHEIFFSSDKYKLRET